MRCGASWHPVCGLRPLFALICARRSPPPTAARGQTVECRALVGPVGRPRQWAELARRERLSAVDRHEEQDSLLEVGSQAQQVEVLRDRLANLVRER